MQKCLNPGFTICELSHLNALFTSTSQKTVLCSFTVKTPLVSSLLYYFLLKIIIVVEIFEH